MIQLTGMMRGIASGMRYLSEMGYVHRVSIIVIFVFIHKNNNTKKFTKLQLWIANGISNYYILPSVFKYK